MSQQSMQLDPLNSPHPIPWSWVMATSMANPTESIGSRSSAPAPKLYYYRSQSLLSPDRTYAAYSRIQMQVHPQMFQSRVSSILFIENLQTGSLQAITTTSPFAGNPFLESGESLGTISIVIPVSWSEIGDRLLAREFESLFCSDVASDYAVVVDCLHQQASTIAPTRIQYTTAVLLGWSQSHPDQVLFQAGNLGETDWDLWTVDTFGHTTESDDDRPVTFGQMVSSVWMGPQAQN